MHILKGCAKNCFTSRSMGTESLEAADLTHPGHFTDDMKVPLDLIVYESRCI